VSASPTNRTTCTHEHEVVSIVLSGRWPEACEASLRAHAEACETCREVVAIASVLRFEKQVMADAPVPAAGQVWWRSAIRARADAARAAARPMVWLQALTGAAAVGLLLATLSVVWPRIAGTIRQVMPSNGTTQELLPLLLLAAVGLLAAPVVFYFAVPKD
jgi:hypothetical protein